MRTYTGGDLNLRLCTLLCGVLVLASGRLAALGRDGIPRRDRDGARQRELQAMDSFAVRYGATDFSLVGEALAAWPDNATNPSIMSVFLSLAQVSLNRFEEGHDTSDLERSLTLFESVARSRAMWGRRPFAGSVVAGLAIGVTRLESECGIGAHQSRIDELFQEVSQIAAEEANAVADVEEQAEEFVSTTASEDATRALLYAAAVSLLHDDRRVLEWDENSRRLAARLSSSDLQAPDAVLALSEAALLYEISGTGIPRELEPFALVPARTVSFRSSSGNTSSQAIGSVDVVEPGDSLTEAIDESRVVSESLATYLRQFPPGSQCKDVE